jgi:predicted acyltransferase
LLGYWALLTAVPVPGYGSGHLGKDDNLGAYIDRSLMGGHLWSESVTWDPEGFLSTLPAIASLLIGILAGEWLRSNRNGEQKTVGLAGAGVLLLAAGRMLHPYFPINKNLWTSSFVLFTGGLAMVALAAFYWFVDVRKWRSGTPPFLVFGMNAILAYALAALVSEISTSFEITGPHGHQNTLHGWLYQGFFVRHASPMNASLGYAIFFVVVIFVMLWPLYRAKIFLRV